MVWCVQCWLALDNLWPLLQNRKHHLTLLVPPKWMQGQWINLYCLFLYISVCGGQLWFIARKIIWCKGWLASLPWESLPALCLCSGALCGAVVLPVPPSCPLLPTSCSPTPPPLQPRPTTGPSPQVSTWPPKRIQILVDAYIKQNTIWSSQVPTNGHGIPPLTWNTPKVCACKKIPTFQNRGQIFRFKTGVKSSQSFSNSPLSLNHNLWKQMNSTENQPEYLGISFLFVILG